MRALLTLLAWLGLALAAQPAAAQAPGAELSARIGDLGAVLQGQGDPAMLFTPAFLDQVPADQVRTIARQLTGQYGAYRGAPRIAPASQYAATFDLEYERATVHMNVSLDPQPPHRINGWFITGATVHGDTLAAVMSEIAALPGATGAAIARLGDGAPAVIAGTTPDRALGIGSTFKLFVLAELSRQIRAGQRRWSDVVPLDRRSIPSGMLQTWPRGAPVTLHTLASLMISISDNSAADTLLHLLGRENVERMMATIGVADPARNRPLLSTLELFALKTGPDSILAAWRAADEAGRRRRLAGDVARIDADHVEFGRLAGHPTALDVEWFASAEDIARAMDWLRREGDAETRAILGIAPGLLAPVRASFAYVGFKNGNEPGVLNYSWLIQTRAGAWYVVTGSWNNPDAPVEEARLLPLLARAIALIRDAPAP